jgi:hypothetical protein
MFLPMSNNQAIAIYLLFYRLYTSPKMLAWNKSLRTVSVPKTKLINTVVCTYGTALLASQRNVGLALCVDDMLLQEEQHIVAP